MVSTSPSDLRKERAFWIRNLANSRESFLPSLKNLAIGFEKIYELHTLSKTHVKECVRNH